MKLKGIIFDLDGTLVDSALNFEAMRNDIGMPAGLPILEYIEERNDPKFTQAAYEVIHRHELKGAEESTLIEGVRELFEFLDEKRIPRGILTRNSKQVTLKTIEKFNLNFKTIITRDDCLAKPNPHGLQLISQEWGIPSSQLIYVGDFLLDIHTAKNANIKSVLLLNEKNESFKEQADITISNLLMLRELFNE